MRVRELETVGNGVVWEEMACNAWSLLPLLMPPPVSPTTPPPLPPLPHPAFPTTTGAHRLKKQIALVAQQNRVTGRDSPLRPLLDAMAAVSVPRALMNSITSAIQEDGELSDNASEQVWRGVSGYECMCCVCVCAQALAFSMCHCLASPA